MVLIHGLWLTPLSWERWIDRYEGLGYRVIAPTWPGMDADIEDLRRDPSAMAGVGITEITDHYDTIIRALDTPPIIMGHSFGGSVTQLLLDRGLGSAGVAIHPAPVKGVLRLPVSALRSAFPVLRNPLNRNRAVALTPKQFHYAFTNTLSREESQAVYERYHVPGPGHGQPQPARRHEGRLQERVPRPAAGGRREQGPHRSALIGQRGRHAPEQGHVGHRVQGVPRPLALHAGAGRLGGGRRLRPRLGHQARRSTHGDLSTRPARLSRPAEDMRSHRKAG